MSDVYIASRIGQWSRWVMRRNDGGLGYPKSVPYINLMPRPEFGSSTPDIQEDCFEIEKCIQALRATNNELHDTIIMAYLQSNMTREQKCKVLGCCEKTYYNRIDRAHIAILGFLNDLIAGVKLPEINIHRVA